MQKKDLTQLDFGSVSHVDASLSERVRGLIGSEILKIAGEIRAMVASGQSICNLTVGDFDPKQFPIPATLLDGIREALEAGETNYPPSDGMLSLRKAVAEHSAREWGVEYPVDSILIAGGARPILYGAYRCVIDPGDKVTYPVPSWNNNHYAWLTGARPVEIVASAEDRWLPTLETLKPHIADSNLLVLNSPLNPSGTVMDPAVLRSIAEAIVEENARRTREGRRHIFFVYDQVYGSLVFGGRRHAHPVALVPEAAPWVITVDGISKSLAATGLRVGWTLAAPAVTARMRDLLGHVGAWAPRAEQVAVASFLMNAELVAAYRAEMERRLETRLSALFEGFSALTAAGYPVTSIDPEGSIYLSLRIDLIGRSFEGTRIATNEQIRRLLLEKAGIAVVPFQAFGLKDDTGWFRLSVGAVSVAAIGEALPRMRALLDAVR